MSLELEEILQTRYDFIKKGFREDLLRNCLASSFDVQHYIIVNNSVSILVIKIL